MIGAGSQIETGYTLRELCAGLEAHIETAGQHDPAITGLTADSREVKPGYLFAAIRGRRVDGHDYIRPAVAAGAAAVLVEASGGSPPAPDLSALAPGGSAAASAPAPAAGIALVRVVDSRQALALLAARWYGLIEARNTSVMRLFGVTGTNGKSTICHLIRAMENRAGRCCASIGTIEYDLVGRRATSSLTTPDAVELSRLLAEARRHGADRAVLEVSSHALDQRRTDGLSFAAAVFTNLSGDHHDYHGGAEPYLAAKKRLFDRLGAEALAVVNADHPATERVVADCRARMVRYGLAPGAELFGTVEEMSRGGTGLRVCHTGGTTELHTPLVGRHNVYNVLAAFGVGVADGLAPEAAAEGIASLAVVPGRLEKVGGTDCPIDVFVDYAHTDDALRNVLRAARQICRGQVTVVFGCGGERDPSKRPRMAAVAAELAEHSVVTSDNPRSEDPQAIIEDILAGFSPQQRSRVRVEPDRAEAIARALREARPGDLILIAGKGHEDYQIVGSARRRFDDRLTAAQCLQRIYGEGYESLDAG